MFAKRRIKAIARRLGQAWRLALGRTTREDARDLHWMIEDRAGWRTLVSIDDDEVLERIQDLGHDGARAEEWAERASARVASKFDTSDVSTSAVDWAMDLVAEYARDDGVDLYARENQDEKEMAS